MNRLKGILTTACVLGLLVGRPSLGQFNSRKARQELEIMKSVLETTVKLALETESSDESAFGEVSGYRPERSSIGGFYLLGQGAVFLIYVPRGFEPPPREMNALGRQLRALERTREVSEEALRRMEDRLRAYRDFEAQHRSAVEAYEEAVLAGEPGSAPAPPEPPPPPLAPDAAPQPEKDRTVRDAELKTRVEELEQRLAERKADFEERQKEYQEHMKVLREALLEAVARHGSSLTTVRSGEYINLIVASSGFGVPEPGAGLGKATVLSVPKQAVEDFRSGKTNLEGFLQSVVEYEI